MILYLVTSIIYDIFLVLVDVYHKEQLVTKEEADEAATDAWDWQRSWQKVAITKDVSAAKRLADILVKYGFKICAQNVAGEFMFSCPCINTVQDPNYWEYWLYAAFMYSLYACIQRLFQ